jgi:hypothetical protein
MLINRLHDPKKSEVIYHYCAAETFLNVIQRKTIRFSDANLLNDAHEVRWGYSVFIKAVNELLNREGRYKNAPPIPREFFDRIDEIWSNSVFQISNFVACFSLDGDSLSQWRAYADDGMGVTIGFKTVELRRLPVQIYEVLYDVEQQTEEMTDALGSSFLEYQSMGLQLDDKWLRERSVEIAASSIALKNPAWRDEKEVRCHHLVDAKLGRASWKLEDGGGIRDGRPLPGQPIQFQARKGVIVPFFDEPFEVSDNHQPILEVVLGPRYPANPGALKFVLGNAGYHNVSIRAAGSAYR